MDLSVQVFILSIRLFSHRHAGFSGLNCCETIKKEDVALRMKWSNTKIGSIKNGMELSLLR